MTTRWLLATTVITLLSASSVQAQQNQCRTAPKGTSTSYCASEAFVTSSQVVTGAGAGIAIIGGLATLQVPYFQASRSGAQTVSSGTPATLIFNNSILDTNSFYTAGTGVFKPTIAGTYEIYSNIFCNGSTVQGCNLNIVKNGTSVFESVGSPPAAGTWLSNIETYVPMNGTTDQITATVLMTCTGTCQINGSSAPNLSWIQGKFISP
jgi:hypothetical protein